MNELVLSSAHLSPQPKQQIDWFSRFCTGHGRVLSGMSFALTNSTSITSAGFAGLISITDRQTNRHTDHATRSATICRIDVRSTAMRHNNNVNCLNALVTCTQCQNGTLQQATVHYIDNLAS